MGGPKKNIRARENEMKKNHGRQLTLKKYSCYGKKNSYKEFDNEKKKKNSWGSKIPLPPPPPPYNFSNDPSLVFALLCLFLFTFFQMGCLECNHIRKLFCTKLCCKSVTNGRTRIGMSLI